MSKKKAMFFKGASGGVTIDNTNFLEVIGDIDDDFIFYDKTGALQTGVNGRNTAGTWCLENLGSTTSSGTGATTNPTDRIAYLYYEGGSETNPSPLKNMQRNIQLDNSSQNLNVDIIHNLNIETEFGYWFEYSDIASPNQTTDWTILDPLPIIGKEYTVEGTLTDAWVSKTFNLSSAPASNLWLRIRYSSWTYKGDLCFSTWREYTI